MQELLPGEASEPAQGQGEDALPGLRLRSIRHRLPLALALGAGSGAALSLSLPPLGWWPVAYLAPIPLLWLVRDAAARRGALLGFAFGIAYFGLLLSWILLFGELAWASLVLVSGVWIAAFGALAPALWRPGHPIRSVIGVAALWTSIEWLRASFPLGGFAWGQLGSTQVEAPMLPLASVTGVWGLSFLVVAIAGALLVGIERWGRGEVRGAIAAPATALVLALAPATVHVPTADGRAIDVAAIQVDVDRASGLPNTEEDRAVAMLNVEMHARLASDPPDLVVWGEGALDPGATQDPATMAAVRAAVSSVGAPTLAGAVVREADGTERTSTLAFDGRGRIAGRYDKVRLVPFGEYVPWRSLLEGRIGAIDQIPVDRTPGRRVHTLSAPGLPAAGTPICYENSFPGIERAMVRQGARFIVLTINNASYGRTAASEQHLAMSRLRAVEQGRWVVHAAVSGISAFVDPNGAVVDRRGLFETAVMRHTIRASDASTPYTRFGDWVPWGSVVTVLALLAVPRVRRRSGPTPPPPPSDPRVLVVLPTYNERNTIGHVIDGLLRLPGRLQLLVVDDGSPDGTAAVVRERVEADARVALIERPRKGGLAGAYGAGFARALAEGYDLVVEMDSDLSHQPAELPALLEAASRADVVVGSRYVPGGSVTNWSRARVALSRAGNRYARWSLGLPLHDATSGFRVYRAPALREITKAPIRSDGYGFQIELVYRAWRAGLALAEVPITFREREHGQSKISRRIVFEALWLVTVWGWKARFRPS